MAKQPMSRSLGWAGLSLLIATSGSLVALAGAAGSWPAVLLSGLAVVLAGVAGLCVFACRHGRSTGGGVLRSLGRTVWAAVRLLADLVP